MEKAGKEGACQQSPSQNHWNLAMDIKRVKDYIYWLYYQYLLITCSYALEPWEQSMFHTIMVTVFCNGGVHSLCLRPHPRPFGF